MSFVGGGFQYYGPWGQWASASARWSLLGRDPGGAVFEPYPSVTHWSEVAPFELVAAGYTRLTVAQPQLLGLGTDVDIPESSRVYGAQAPSWPALQLGVQLVGLMLWDSATDLLMMAWNLGDTTVGGPTSFTFAPWVYPDSGGPLPGPAGTQLVYTQHLNPGESWSR